MSKFKAETASKFDKINDIYTFAKGSIPKPAMQNPSPKMKEKLEFIEDEKEPRQINSSQIQYPNEWSNEISYSISSMNLIESLVNWWTINKYLFICCE